MDMNLLPMASAWRPEWLLPAALLLAVLPFPAARAAETIDIPYEKFVLDNGLTLIVHEDHKAPIVSVNLWYHVGSKNENPGKTGFAHLFEHLMFNGSENFNQDYFQALEKVGATDLNGTTNNDRTNYFQNVPTPALDLVLWLESDRMGHLLGAIDQPKLDEQRGVVQNEKRQGENQPYGKTYELITKNTFPAGHPYSWTVIGEMEDLDAASLEDVQGWFKEYYGAANAILVIAGDIDAETAKAKVEKYFGDIAPGPPVARQQKWIAERTGEHRQTLEDRVPQARLYKVWNVPPYGAKDAVYLDLVTDVLAAGKNSRFYKRLVYEDQIATNVSASIYAREIAGQVYVTATAQPGGELAPLEQALNEELAKFLESGPTESELQRIKTQHRARFLRGVERIGGFGGKSDILAQNEVFTGRPDHYKQMLAWADEATAANLRDAARRWLADGAYILEVKPFPPYEGEGEGVDRSQMPEVSGFPDLEMPPLERTQLSNGLNVILAQRHEIPLVDLSLLVDAGYAADQHSKPGTAALALEMMDEGTESRTALEISEELAQLGAQLSSSSSIDSSSVTLSALKERLAASLDIFADVALNPSFPQEELARLKKQQLARIQQEKSQPFGIALRLLPGLVYGSDHAYGVPLTGSGTEEAVEALSRDDLAGFHQTWFQPDNATLTVVGDITMEELRPLLEERFGSWEQTAQPPQKNIAHVEVPASRRIYLVDRPQAQQSVIIAGLPAPPTNNPQEPAIDTMNAILGGTFTSRVNMNLREDKHWAYGASTFLVDAKGQRLFLAMAPVQTDKTRESILELDKELREILGDRPPTADELAKAKANLTLQLPGRFETKRALLGAINDTIVYGLPDDYYEKYPERIAALTSEHVEAAAQAVVGPDSLVWIVVGDKGKIAAELDGLSFGELRFLTPDGEPAN